MLLIKLEEMKYPGGTIQNVHALDIKLVIVAAPKRAQTINILRPAGVRGV